MLTRATLTPQAAMRDGPVREAEGMPTLIGTTGHIENNLAKCVEMLEMIEGSVTGMNQTTNEKMSDKPMPVIPLSGRLKDLSAFSAALAMRLEGLAAEIGCR